MTDAPSKSPFIVRAAEGRALRDARTILAEALEHAACIRSEAEVERAAVLASARQDGLREAARETASLAAQAAAAIERFWAERETELRDLALAVAHRVLSRLPTNDLMVRLASEAIAEHGRDVRLSLRVSPVMVDPLRAALDEEPFGERVTVTADLEFANGDCALIHPRGRTEIGLLAQFRAMVAAIPQRGDGFP